MVSRVNTLYQTTMQNWEGKIIETPSLFSSMIPYVKNWKPSRSLLRFSNSRLVKQWYLVESTIFIIDEDKQVFVCKQVWRYS